LDIHSVTVKATGLQQCDVDVTNNGMIFLLNFIYLPTGSKVTGEEQTGGQTDW
jgi:hypothetical protein